MNLSKTNRSTVASELLRRNLAPSPDRATAYVLAGLVRKNGQKVDKAGTPCLSTDELTIALPSEDVGRGAQKLAGAFAAFRWNVQGKVCADVGSSTGGFTQVLLRQGAERVFAIDVGYGELAWELRSDPRVTVLERTNARTLDRLPQQISRATIDLSFISLCQVLPKVLQWGAEDLELCALVKPQFEAEPELVPSGGVITDTALHRNILRKIITWCASNGFEVLDGAPSPLKGRDGNQEFFLLLKRGARTTDIDALLERCLSVPRVTP